MDLTVIQLKIIRAYAKNNMRVTEAARDLKYHRNSIMYHFERIHEKTGLDPKNFYDLVKLLRMAGDDL